MRALDNITYDSGFTNPGASLDASYSMYDQVTKVEDSPTGEGNYCMLEESTFSDTYESVSADTYSEVKKPVVQVKHSVLCVAINTGIDSDCYAL